MTAAPYLVTSDEADWTGHERVWASVQQYPPKKTRSSWWLVLVGAVLVAVTLRWM